jgi:hypothetical protein
MTSNQRSHTLHVESIQAPGDARRRQHLLRGAQLNCRARHPEDRAGLFVLRDRDPAGLPDGEQTLAPSDPMPVSSTPAERGP